MHTYTEHIYVGESCGEMVSRDTGHRACLGQRTGCANTPLFLCFLLHSSRLLHLSQLLCPPSFHYFPGQPPSASPISLTSPPFSPLLSPLSHHPHCPFLLSPFPQTMYTVCWGGPSIFLKGTPPPLSTTRRMFPDCKWPFSLLPATFLLYHPSPHFLANRGHIVIWCEELLASIDQVPVLIGVYD